MRTPTLRLLVAVALIALPCPAHESEPIAIRATPIPLYADGDGPPQVGRLRYRVGLHLRAASEDFGGFSGLVIDAGGRLTAVSDQGHWLTAELRFTADGALEGIGAGRMGPLCDDDGAPVAGKERRDAEELEELPGRGFLVSFEHHHRIVLYDADENGHSSLSGVPRPFPFPPDIVHIERNAGMEAVALLADGRLLTFAEELRTIEHDIIGWIGDPAKGDWRHLTLATREDFLPTGAATLPAGDVVLLGRSFTRETGSRVRLSLIEAASLVPGARLQPRELALLAPPATVDNMEAVAVQCGPQGEVFIYLLSDDNYNDHQRTLLMQFELVDGEP